MHPAATITPKHFHPMNQDQRYLDLAAKLAMRGAGRVEPNPLVGCVLVRNKEVIGMGHHRAQKSGFDL